MNTSRWCCRLPTAPSSIRWPLPVVRHLRSMQRRRTAQNDSVCLLYYRLQHARGGGRSRRAGRQEQLLHRNMRGRALQSATVSGHRSMVRTAQQSRAGAVSNVAYIMERNQSMYVRKPSHRSSVDVCRLYTKKKGQGKRDINSHRMDAMQFTVMLIASDCTASLHQLNTLSPRRA